VNWKAFVSWWAIVLAPPAHLVPLPISVLLAQVVSKGSPRNQHSIFWHRMFLHPSPGDYSSINAKFGRKNWNLCHMRQGTGIAINIRGECMLM
jgi:hypothetical protein